MPSAHTNPYYNPIFYWFGKNGSHAAFTLFWRRKVFGRENIPPQGTPVIFAGNHRSLADPQIIGSAIPYPVNYFAKEELFQIPVLGFIIRRVNAFPVRRGAGDVGAVKMAQRILEAGEGLVLFPEGGRRLDPKRQWVAKSGVAMLACSTGAKVVPVGVKNAHRFSKFGALEVHFGKPLQPPSDAGKDAYESFSQLVITKIRELVEEPKTR
jgi:1-acyl-sn-glycerol-3-phosphate acyltransferase